MDEYEEEAIEHFGFQPDPRDCNGFRHKCFKVLMCAGVCGIGAKLIVSLVCGLRADKVVCMPFFPNILDAVLLAVTGLGLVISEIWKYWRLSR